MKPYYYIDSANANVRRNKHHTLESAVKDAEFMAESYPGISFEVLQVVAISSTPKPNATTFYLDRATE
jgi:hypothetical protein